ncbi:hypothetical protein ACM614_26365 [Streptomyces sp. 12297]|uniref:hypothetical protein n=1 Tax=Streptomyces sp. NBC_00239 TaxID=2903640 RepID=UPI002E2B25A3|nr:hypothetical protein [Streptomyces sp. NBC_00239]
MRTRLPGLAAALLAASLAFTAPAAQAAPSPKPSSTTDAQQCVTGGGTVEYDSDTGQWTCKGGKYNKQPIR